MMMSRPETIRTRPLTTAPLWTRVRRRYDRAWSGYVLARKKSRHRRQIGMVADKRVAYIFGCQRSGTNMTLRTLDRSLDVDRFEESDPRAFVHCRILGKEVRDALIARSTAKCVLFKPICDSHRVLELLAEHPGSKAVWIYRNYKDVADSAVNYWGDQTQAFIEDLLEGGGDWGQGPWNREKVAQECLSKIREACADGLSPHGACAIFWYMRNRTFFEQDLEHNPDTIIARYEDVVRSPREEFERLCRFLSVGFYPEMVSKVFTSSIRKRPFPAISKRIKTLCENLGQRLDRVRAAAE